MKRAITEEQVQELFAFCWQHYVYDFDVQLELVDHLASSVEELWEEQPELDFHTALKKSFAGFGIYGFSKIKAQREKALRRKYAGLLWRYILEFYRFPKIILTFTLTIGVFILFQIIEEKGWIVVSYFLLMFFFGIYYWLKVLPKQKIKIQKGKRFMLLTYLKQNQSLIAAIAQTPMLAWHSFHIIEGQNINQPWALFLMSFFMVLLGVLCYAQAMFLPRKIKEHFMSEFSEFAL